jgi:bifunctional enzyme CysN/CysC
VSATSERELVRVAAIGSVDDGKSTLIGRLLLDAGLIPDDVVEAARRSSARRGDDYFDLSLITDGLRSEREQGITIDVAYRYFATERRSFILADCPGHVSFTRNMVTGTSLAQVAILLVDARQGLTQQTRRHGFIAGMLRVPHVIVCVNKMDLVGYDQAAFDRVVEEYEQYAARLGIVDVTFVPTDALHGDSVVGRSAKMSWYEGPTLLYQLEHVHAASDRNLVDVRFPVQLVVRPRSATAEHHDYRGYAGRVASGVMKPGDPVMILPSHLETTIEAIETFDGAVEEAYPPMSVTVRLAHDVDITRGDMLVRPHNRPNVLRDVEAMVCMVGETRIEAGSELLLQHTTRLVRARVEEVRYKVDIDSLHRREDQRWLGLNDIGRIRIRTGDPIFCDAYYRNTVTGTFVLIDPSDNATIGAGIVLPLPTEQSTDEVHGALA